MTTDQDETDEQFWHAVCDCGYVVAGDDRDQAERFAFQHSDNFHDAWVETR